MSCSERVEHSYFPLNISAEKQHVCVELESNVSVSCQTGGIFKSTMTFERWGGLLQGLLPVNLIFGYVLYKL